MSKAQRERLDKFYARWQSAVEVAQVAIQRANLAQQEAVIQEARFKGAVEFVGAKGFKFEGGHVILLDEEPHENNA